MPRDIIPEGSAMRKYGFTFSIQRKTEAMDYVRSRTSLPVPRVLDTQLGSDPNDRASFLMVKHSGVQINHVWADLSEHAKDNTISQFRAFLAELHSLRPPAPGWIGSCSKGGAYDHRIWLMSTCGPFETIADFYSFLYDPTQPSPSQEHLKEFRSTLSATCEVHFAHADLSWENILIKPNTGDITAMLDWEMAGFWPEWWEYSKALYEGRRRRWWVEIMDLVMRRYTAETEADRKLDHG